MKPPPLPDPLVGTIVAGRFRIERRLAEGGFGAVYRATQLSIGRAVALKLLSPGAGDAAAPARFAREARALGHLSGPNVVRVLDYGALPDGRCFLAMELLDGESLDQSLARGRMSIPDLVAAGIQICRALEEAHGAGIVHRDIKPSNIFVQRAGAGWLVKLIDFGAALRAGEPSLTAAHYVVGTPSFLSPEQIRGLPADARSDLYGLGLVLFEMLTGLAPFSAADTVAVLSHHLHTPPPRTIALRPETPPALDALVAALLSKDPSARPQSARAVRAALMAIGRPVPGRPPRGRLRALGSVWPKLLLAAGLVVATGAAIAVVGNELSGEAAGDGGGAAVAAVVVSAEGPEPGRHDAEPSAKGTEAASGDAAVRSAQPSWPLASDAGPPEPQIADAGRDGPEALELPKNEPRAPQLAPRAGPGTRSPRGVSKAVAAPKPTAARPEAHGGRTPRSEVDDEPAPPVAPSHPAPAVTPDLYDSMGATTLGGGGRPGEP